MMGWWWGGVAGHFWELALPPLSLPTPWWRTVLADLNLRGRIGTLVIANLVQEEKDRETRGSSSTLGTHDERTMKEEEQVME